MSNIQEFFAAMSSEASLILISLVLVGFLFGILVGYLLRNASYARLSREYQQLEADLTQKDVELEQLRHNLSVLERNKSEQESELEKAKADRIKMAGRIAPLEKELEQSQSELEEAKTAIQGYLSTIDDMHHQLSGLKTRNERLAEEDPPQNLNLEGNGENMAKAFEVLSAQLRDLQRSNKQISAELKKLKAGGVPATPYPEASPTTPSPEADPSFPKAFIPPETQPLQATEEPATSRDDLTRIGGIGPFLQEKLYENNIVSYRQIAGLRPQDIKELTQRIGYIPGRIEKDDWVGQARALLTAEKR